MTTIPATNSTAPEMIQTLTANYVADAISEERTGVVAGHDARYVYILNQPEENETAADATLCLYVDTIQNSCVLVDIVSRKTENVAEVPTEEELLAVAEKVMEKLTVAK